MFSVFKVFFFCYIHSVQRKPSGFSILPTFLTISGFKFCAIAVIAPVERKDFAENSLVDSPAKTIASSSILDTVEESTALYGDLKAILDLCVLVFSL